MKGQEVINYMGQRKMPDIEKVRQNCHEHFMAQITDENFKHNTKRARRVVPLVAVLAILFTMTVTVFGLGGMEWLSERFNQAPFVAIAEPVMVYDEDQGIVMTVIGMQQIDDITVIYYSLHDKTGQNRITENTRALVDFGMSFSGRRHLSEELLHFDETSNTAYFEMLITASTASPRVALRVFSIVFDEAVYNDIPIDLPLANLSVPETLSLQSGQHYSVSVGLWHEGYQRLGQNIPSVEKVLLPDYLVSLPFADNTWISNIGIIDGRLHVQTIVTRWNEAGFVASGSLAPFLQLANKDGDIIDGLFFINVRTDENFVPLTGQEAWERDQEGETATILSEFVFDYIDVDINNLENYTILASARVFNNAIEGCWSVSVRIEDASNQILSVNSDKWIGEYHFQFVAISPFGVRTVGQVSADGVLEIRENFGMFTNLIAGQFVVYLEIAGELIPLKDGQSDFGWHVDQRRDWQRNSFNMFWLADSPIDVSTVTAIIINGYRIPVGN